MQLNFDNQFADLGDSFSVRMAPRPLPNPHWVSLNVTAAKLIDLSPDDLGSDEALQFFSGAEMITGAAPLAMVYAGHQFGGYSPRLGDGRGLLLGQIRNRNNILWDLHLKGAGQTPFCRGADGRAVLRSSIREYLASEALHHLGIPTSRALALIGSDEPVMRERYERAAGLIRLSESHVRFGSFEYFFYTNQHDNLKKLADYVLNIHYPDCRPEYKDDATPYDRMLLEIVGRTAEMIAHWQAFGFAHGVMNTDNMSILGQTFDYGPYGFIDAFDPGFICNHSDNMGRYAFNQQPNIGRWNCLALAHALKPLILPDTAELLHSHYQTRYYDCYDTLMNRKLGLEQRKDGDRNLVSRLLGLLAENSLDYTNFFRRLCDGPLPPALTDWVGDYRHRLMQETTERAVRRHKMRAINPKYILRNYLAQTAIERAEHGDFTEVDKLLSLLRCPFDDQPEHEAYAAEPPDWGRHLDISCSS